MIHPAVACTCPIILFMLSFYSYQLPSDFGTYHLVPEIHIEYEHFPR